MKFKEGDRVRFVKSKAKTTHAAADGATATVTSSRFRSVYYDEKPDKNPGYYWTGGQRYLNLLWDETPKRNGQMHGGYDEECFELVEKEKPQLDLSKPVRFWNGVVYLPARIVDTKRKDETGYTVLALVSHGNHELAYVFKPDGKCPMVAYRLENVPQPPVSSTRFFLLTEDGNIWACPAKAEEAWVKNRIGQKAGNQLIVGFKRVTITEGEDGGVKGGCCGNCACGK